MSVPGYRGVMESEGNQSSSVLLRVACKHVSFLSSPDEIIIVKGLFVGHYYAEKMLSDRSANPNLTVFRTTNLKPGSL